MTAQTETVKSGAGRIVISVDAMGGDRGPAAVVAGISRSAKKNPDIAFMLHGPKDDPDQAGGQEKASGRTG